MRRIRTMDGELTERENTVKTIDGTIIKKEDSIYSKADGYYYSKKDARIKTDFYLKDEYINIQSRGVNKIIINVKNSIEEYGYTRLGLRNFSLKLDDPDNYPVLIVTSKYSNGAYATYRYVKSTNLQEVNAKDLMFSDRPDYKYGDNLQYLQFDNTFEYDPKDISKSTEMGTFSPTYRISEGIKTTFGVELETCVGRVRPWEYSDLNVECVYDGSLKDENGVALGGEYVTGILKGDMGFNQLNKITKVLSKNCKVDKRCGLHVHVGINPTKSFIVHLYKLLLDIEEDIFSMIPKSRRGGTHSKCLNTYNFDELKKVSNVNTSEEDLEFVINMYFDKIYKLNKCTSSLPGVNKNSRYVKHPLGDKCKYDKSTPRYCWVNLIPALFIRDHYKGEVKDYNGFTVEFRPHPGSLNFNKIKNWTKICLAIVNFAENYPNKIAKQTITLSYLLKQVYPKSADSLIEYINERKRLFEKSTGERVDLEEVNENNVKGIKELI